MRLLLYTGIAQLVEQRPPKPRAVGPSPSARATVCNTILRTTARQAGDGHTHLTKSICPLRCRAFPVFIDPPSPGGPFYCPSPLSTKESPLCPRTRTGPTRTALTAWLLSATRRRSTPPKRCAVSAASRWIFPTNIRIRCRLASTTSSPLPRAGIPVTSTICSWPTGAATGRNPTSCSAKSKAKRNRPWTPPGYCLYHAIGRPTEADNSNPPACRQSLQVGGFFVMEFLILLNLSPPVFLYRLTYRFTRP